MNYNEVSVSLVSLGCPKNQCDAELMMSLISRAGYRLVREPGQADVVVINTCCFIQSAKEEAIEEILEAAARKADGINKRVIITGCLAERYRTQLEHEFPEVDGIVCLADNNKIAETIKAVLRGERVTLYGDIKGHCMEGTRMLSTMPHYAYLRIADGCDNRCSYCAIPLFRGGYRSRPMENIAKEARELVRRGVKELILVAQDVTAYDSLPKLLKELTQIDNLKWVRMLYCYPQHITDELIETIKSEPKIVKYIDLPIQHCNDDILAKMNRPYGKKALTELLRKLRCEIPGLVLRTTVITGFPGETEEQFTELAEFVHSPETRFEHLGCFAYSQEEGTAAAEFDGQIDIAERQRRSEIISEQQDIRVAEWLGSLIESGREYEAVVEGFDKYAELYFGRCYFQSPEIDSMTYFSVVSKDSKEPKPVNGQFVNIKPIEVMDNNLIGVIE